MENNTLTPTQPSVAIADCSPLSARSAKGHSSKEPSFALKGEGDLLSEQTTGTLQILTDSRSLCLPAETIFFALTTHKGDGHKYVKSLYNRGVRHFVVTHEVDGCEDATFYIVTDVLQSLQRLAQKRRELFSCPVIGITGSNGKTIVKEWLYQIFTCKADSNTPLPFRERAGVRVVVRSPRSYNSQTGVPLSVWQMNEATELGIFEAGISQMGEMERLQPIIQPTIGVFTCLGAAHKDGFDSLQVKCEEKMQLFKDADVLICPADDLVVRRAVAASQFHGRLLTWSRKDRGAWLYINKVERNENSTTFETSIVNSQWPDSKNTFTIPFIDDASLSNAITCTAVCLYLGMTPEDIAKRLRRLEPVAMRLEVKEGVRGLTLINDSYNSDLTSLDIALDFMARRPEPKGRRRTLILSEIQQAGGDTLPQAIEMAKRRGVERIIFIGKSEALETIEAIEANKNLESFPSTEAFLASDTFHTMHDEVVLLKGARAYGFDRITERLEQRVHQTILEVDLGALVQNLAYYRSFLKPETKMVCMVKAAAYGAGAVEVARTLQEHRVDYLAVAVADEGAELRRAGITTGIIVMNPEMSALHTLFEYNLEPEIYSFRLLDALMRAAQTEGITQWPVHIKLDTGMHRLGFDPMSDMPKLIEHLTHQQTLLPRSVFSHFVGSDSEGFDEFSAEQFRRFNIGADALQAAFPHHILRHICNTAGIEHFPERQMDMVRLGLGLYGINPIMRNAQCVMRNNLTDNAQPDYASRITHYALHPVSTLKTTILQIHDVPAGETVGYSRRGKLTRDSRIAALPIGYADGLDRLLGNGRGHCIVNGKEAPYVGNICMDVCMIDVTDIDCQEGDTAIIFGTPQLPVASLSDAIGTIPYEILTSVSNRVARVYYRE